MSVGNIMADRRNEYSMTDQDHKHNEQLSEDTLEMDTSPFLGDTDHKGGKADDSLFERYDRRSLSTIIEQQRAYRESQAAQAARVILGDAILPEFDPDLNDIVDYEDFEDSESSHPRYRRIRVQRVTGAGLLVSPGAQIVYVLLTIAALSGTLGLAYSTDSPQMLLLAGIATPMLLPICVWRWLSWLDSAPYYYRLLTTLGEDARNLLDYRLLWKKSNKRVR